jgi:hypothetical protein
MSSVKIVNPTLVDIEDKDGTQSTINLENIKGITSSTTLTPSQVVRLKYIFLFLSILTLAWNISSNIIETRISDDKLQYIYINLGGELRYQEKQNGSIYHVKYENGNAYIERNLPVFFVMLVVINIPLFIAFLYFGGASLWTKKNEHWIQFEVKSLGSKKYTLGSYEDTKQFYSQIKETWEKVKLGS